MRSGGRPGRAATGLRGQRLQRRHVGSGATHRIVAQCCCQNKPRAAPDRKRKKTRRQEAAEESIGEPTATLRMLPAIGSSAPVARSPSARATCRRPRAPVEDGSSSCRRRGASPPRFMKGNHEGEVRMPRAQWTCAVL
jgi:hypothetical protein